MKLSRRALVTLATLATTVLGSMLFWARNGREYDISNARKNLPFFQSTTPTPSITERTFLLLKTGVEVVYDRLPAHVATTLKKWPNHAVYADANVTISGVEVVDCLALLDEPTLNSKELQAYRLRLQGKAQNWNWGSKEIHDEEGQQTGWNLDRFKNIPAYAHAWATDKTKDWYVMIDADSYLFTYTLEWATSKYDPNDIIYLGKAVGGEPFAHGGSGIVLSRGAMRALYGDTEETMLEQIRKGTEIASRSCCGDSVVAITFTDTTGIPSGQFLDHTELGQFQGGQVPTFMVPIDEQWCNAAPTFHEVTAWEVYLLDRWETETTNSGRNTTYAQLYHDFIRPQVVAELSDWVFHPGNYDGAEVIINVETLEGDAPEVWSKTACIEKCHNIPDCTMWTYLGGEKCRIFHNVVTPGSKMNKYNPRWNGWPEVASGYMVDRIKEFRHNQPCETGSNEEEGLFIEHLKNTGQLDAEGLAVGQKIL